MATKKFKAGEYYIGDPCYVIADDNWIPLLKETNYLEDEEQYYKGEQIFCGGTAHGDGCYIGSNHKSYPVDAGLIGIIPMSVVDKKENVEDLGSLETFNKDFVVDIADGIFKFDNIVINTDEEDDEDYDEDEDKYYDEDEEDDY